MDAQQIIDLTRLKLDAALAFNAGSITEEQYASIHNTTAAFAGEARLLIPGRVAVDRSKDVFATIRANTISTPAPKGNARKRGKK